VNSVEFGTKTVSVHGMLGSGVNVDLERFVGTFHSRNLDSAGLASVRNIGLNNTVLGNCVRHVIVSAGASSHLVVRKVGTGRGHDIDRAVFIATALIVLDGEISPEGRAGRGGRVLGEGRPSGSEGTVLNRGCCKKKRRSPQKAGPVAEVGS
jgi:hypothetical protein